MAFYKYISTILHPIVIPTIGVMLYFLVVPTSYNKEQRFYMLSLVFITTYLIPLLLLIFFKRLRIIKNYRVETIKERKIPIILMVFLYFFLGQTMNTLYVKDLSLLFYSTSFGLFVLFLFFFFQKKISIHLLSLGIPLGFFMLLSHTYQQSFLIEIICIFLISGLVGSSRLHLQAHTHKEVFSGFFLGIFSVFFVFFIYNR